MKDKIFPTIFGPVKGRCGDGVVRFQNIRYAVSKRYQRPELLSPKEGFLHQSERPHVCPQHLSPFLDRMIEQPDAENFIADEATQFLSVTTPEDFKNKEKIPILVWIHGGSYEIGCGDLPTSDPSKWVREQDIIVVSASYRLGLFGFLGGVGGRPANLGLLDVVEALKWIRNYSSVFHGDSENITLLGQSSGGDLIAHLMIADLPGNLFRRLIIQSAPLGLRKGRQKMYRELSEKTFSFIHEEDPLKMVEWQQKALPKFSRFGMKSLMPFGLQYGAYPLPDEKETMAMWRRNAKKYEVLIGLNHDETSFYLATSEQVKKYTGNSFSKKILQKAIRFSTEKIYGKPARQFAENLRKGGGNVTLFRIHSVLQRGIGAAHCFDLPLLFGNESGWKKAGLLKDVPWRYIEENGKKLRFFWTEFMRNGALPVNEKLPEGLHFEVL